MNEIIKDEHIAVKELKNSNIDNIEKEKQELEKGKEELEIRIIEVNGLENKLKFREKLLKVKDEKISDREDVILQEEERMKKYRSDFRMEKINLQEVCEKRASNIIENTKLRNAELANKVTQLSKFEYELEAIKYELESKTVLLNQTTSQLFELKNKIREYEDSNDVELMGSLKDKIESFDKIEQVNRRLTRENEALKEKNMELEIEISDKETYIVAKQILTNKLERARSQLRYMKRLEESKGTGEDSSQVMFEDIINNQINEDKENNRINYQGDSKFIKEFIQYCKRNGFIYSEDLVRSFLASLRSSKMTILKGYSGTGKSSLPMLLANYLKAECVVVPVQPNWRSKQDIIGFYNYFTNKFIPTELTQTLLRANVSKDRIFLVVLDEMNLSRVEYYFSEFNSKLWLSNNERKIELFEGVTNYEGKVSEYLVLV